MESGKSKNPTIDTVKKLAKALNVTIDELVK
ncbi:helix-turn-helix domain-containing protein [Clostridium perfringens]|nr:helix-turn-helix transcriptional regulator [Clostridium perfringens]MCX0355502.1 helix-turn-helix domain-containing protein [Clostridium perfringens]